MDLSEGEDQQALRRARRKQLDERLSVLRSSLRLVEGSTYPEAEEEKAKLLTTIEQVEREIHSTRDLKARLESWTARDANLKEKAQALATA